MAKGKKSSLAIAKQKSKNTGVDSKQAEALMFELQKNKPKDYSVVNNLFIGYDNDEILSALVGEIISYPQKKVFRIITWSTKSGHDYEAWIDLFDTIEYFAKSKGCDSIEAWTRKGLARKLKWDNEYSVITKNI